MEKPWFEDWFNSPFYHQLYFNRDEQEAADFIGKLVAHLQPAPGALMLDIACGKGRHARILADMGFNVTGIDLSPGSIAHARQFENDHLEFYQHDMRLPFRINYFHYAFNFFTSFGYFKTRREHDDAIRTIAGSLRNNGFLVIDYLNVHYAEFNLVRNEEKTINGAHYSITRWDDEDFFYKKITVTHESLATPFSATEQVAKFSPGDFNDMFAYQGLQTQEVFGDYAFGHYDVRKSPRMILIARKMQR
jgi:SAM-dependent methyltransferase